MLRDRSITAGFVGTGSARVRNKVLPSMVFGAAIAMGATTVLGLTPGTAAEKGRTAGDTPETVADESPAPGAVAVAAAAAPPPGPVAVVPAPRPSSPRLDAPRSPRHEDISARDAAVSRVPVPRRPAAAAAPARRPAATPTRPTGVLGSVTGTVGQVVGGAAKAVPEAVGDVTRGASTAAGGVTRGAGKAVDGVTGGLGLN